MNTQTEQIVADLLDHEHAANDVGVRANIGEIASLLDEAEQFAALRAIINHGRTWLANEHVVDWTIEGGVESDDPDDDLQVYGVVVASIYVREQLPLLVVRVPVAWVSCRHRGEVGREIIVDGEAISGAACIAGGTLADIVRHGSFVHGVVDAMFNVMTIDAPSRAPNVDGSFALVLVSALRHGPVSIIERHADPRTAQIAALEYAEPAYCGAERIACRVVNLDDATIEVGDPVWNDNDDESGVVEVQRVLDVETDNGLQSLQLARAIVDITRTDESNDDVEIIKIRVEIPAEHKSWLTADDLVELTG